MVEAVETATGFGFLLGFGVAFELALGVGLTVGLGVGLALAFALTVGFELVFVAAVALGCTVGVGVSMLAVADGEVSPGADDEFVWWVGRRCAVALGVGVGSALLGIANTYGATAGSALAEFLNPLRPDQLSANAVNATTATAKATNNSVERRGHLLSYSLNTATG